MTDTVRIKRGSTFLLECAVTDDDGTPTDITGWTIACQIRDMHDLLIADVTVDAHTPASGRYQLLDPDTNDWPVGNALMDIAYTDVGGRDLASETLNVRIEREVTQR